jgi:hypothetical protein
MANERMYRQPRPDPSEVSLADEVAHVASVIAEAM